jgi:hypothetical protein
LMPSAASFPVPCGSPYTLYTRCYCIVDENFAEHFVHFYGKMRGKSWYPEKIDECGYHPLPKKTESSALVKRS